MVKLMEYYKIIGQALRLPAGSDVGLLPADYSIRDTMVERLGGSVYKLLHPLDFKSGMTIGLQSGVAKGLHQYLSPVLVAAPAMAGVMGAFNNLVTAVTKHKPPVLPVTDDDDDNDEARAASVLKLHRAGASPSGIAQRLDLSIGTVNTILDDLDAEPLIAPPPLTNVDAE